MDHREPATDQPKQPNDDGVDATGGPVIIPTATAATVVAGAAAVGGAVGAIVGAALGS